MEQELLIEAVRKINRQSIQVHYPSQLTPFSFPILVDRLSRTNLSSESVEDKIAKILAQMDLDS
jgi:ATP-dependent Lhr-like helicase